MSNRSGTTYSAPTDANRRPVMMAVSAADSVTPLPLEIDPNTGALLVGATVTVAAADLPKVVVSGQQTVTTSAAAMPTGALTQGVVVESAAANVNNIYIGPATVTASTGIELQPGATLGIAISNVNKLYVICAAGSPVITYLGS